MDQLKKMEALVADKAFMEKLSKMESVEEITAALNEAGIEITVDEMDEGLEAFLASRNGELSEENLDSVAGGISVVGVVVAAGMLWTGLSALAGVIDGFSEKNKKKKKK